MPFKKGQSGNPGGRPKSAVSVTAHIRAKLAKYAKLPDGRRVKRIDALAEKIIEQALAGDTQMIKLVWERVDGKVADRLKIEDRNNRGVHASTDWDGLLAAATPYRTQNGEEPKAPPEDGSGTAPGD